MLTEKPKIFISHSWDDKLFVRRLENELKLVSTEVRVDHSDVRGGDQISKWVSDTLEWCNTLILVWSNASSVSKWVELEWNSAINLHKRIIPCLLDDVKLPAILSGMAYIDFRNYDEGISRLRHELLVGDSSRKTDSITSSYNAPPPIFKLRGDGFLGGDDAVFSLVFDALRQVERGFEKPFLLELPGIDENLQRINMLKALKNRTEQESKELVDRIQSHEYNREYYEILETCFKIILTDNAFRISSAKLSLGRAFWDSSKLSLSPRGTWEALIGLRVQLWSQLSFDKRKTLRLTTIVTDRIYGHVLLTLEEYISENSRYLNEYNNKMIQGIDHGKFYDLSYFTPQFVYLRCLPAIAIILSRAIKDKVPEQLVNEASDVTTWRLSQVE